MQVLSSKKNVWEYRCFDSKWRGVAWRSWTTNSGAAHSSALTMVVRCRHQREQQNIGEEEVDDDIVFASTTINSGFRWGMQNNDMPCLS
jgi:hypothetical protein